MVCERRAARARVVLDGGDCRIEWGVVVAVGGEWALRVGYWHATESQFDRYFFAMCSLQLNAQTQNHSNELADNISTIEVNLNL